jgi:hypothetical protein
MTKITMRMIIRSIMIIRRRRSMTRRVGRTILMKEMRSMITTRRRCVMMIRARM